MQTPCSLDSLLRFALSWLAAPQVVHTAAANQPLQCSNVTQDTLYTVGVYVLVFKVVTKASSVT